MTGLFFCGDLKYCPYIERYIERLEMKSVKYNVYFWNRTGGKMNLPANYIYYNMPSKLNKNMLEKLFDFRSYQKWCISKIISDKPNKVILLSTLDGMLISKTLRKNKIPYIFDIRDYSFEYVPFFKLIEKRIIKKSIFTAISSKGFCNFLPKSSYIIAHNFNKKEKLKNYIFQKSSGPIKIVWNGVMRYFNFQKKYIDALKNDPRFLMIYHGDGPELDLYKSYCQKEKINNVIFTGSYDNRDKEKLLSDADILNNCYGYLKNAGNKLKYAVSNKFYDGIIYHIPQLVEPEGYKTDLVLKSKIGINFTANECFADSLYNYYHSINENEFNKSCDRIYESILAEDQEYIKKIDNFVININEKAGN